MYETIHEFQLPILLAMNNDILDNSPLTPFSNNIARVCVRVFEAFMLPMRIGSIDKGGFES